MECNRSHHCVDAIFSLAKQTKLISLEIEYAQIHSAKEEQKPALIISYFLCKYLRCFNLNAEHQEVATQRPFIINEAKNECVER